MSGSEHNEQHTFYDPIGQVDVGKHSSRFGEGGDLKPEHGNRLIVSNLKKKEEEQKKKKQMVMTITVGVYLDREMHLSKPSKT